MALALVLLIGSALLIRTFLAIRQVDPGFDARNVLTMRMSLTEFPQLRQPAGMTRVIDDGLRRLRAIPGVEAAGATCCVPLEDRFRLVFQIAGRPEAGGVTGFALVSPGYFETFEIPVLSGRAFTERDERGPPVIPDQSDFEETILVGPGPFERSDCEWPRCSAADCRGGGRCAGRRSRSRAAPTAV